MTKKQEEMAAMFENYEGSTEGFEDMNGDTQSVPFLRLLQDLSPAVRKKHADYVEGAEAGMLINTATNKLYPTPLKFVVGKFERYYIEWGSERSGFKGAHAVELIEKRIGKDLIMDDGYKVIDPQTNNTFSDTYVYYVLLPDHMEDGVMIMSLSSSQLKEAKRLNRNLRSTMIPNTTRRALPFFMVWNYDIAELSNDKGEWCGPKFVFDAFVTQDVLSYVEDERKELPNKPVNFALLDEDAGKLETKDGDVPY
ncbi:MAG: hypothetical protein GY771_02875 [bacterium]|nr:hypothetical protein [bacterium]